MDRYDETAILARKNFEAMNVAMQHFEAKRAEDAKHMQSLEATVAQLVQQMQAIELQLALLRARLQGHGVS